MDANFGKVALNGRGEWDNGYDDYRYLDFVTYQGSSYFVKITSGLVPVGTPPTDAAYFGKLASKGDQGEKGEKGDKGDTGDGVEEVMDKIQEIHNNIQHREVYGAENFTVDIGSDPGILATPKYPVKAGDKIIVASYAKYQKAEFFDLSNVKTEFGSEGDHQNELRTIEFFAPSDGTVRGVSYTLGSQDFFIEAPSEDATQMYVTPRELVDFIKNSVKVWKPKSYSAGEIVMNNDLVFRVKAGQTAAPTDVPTVENAIWHVVTQVLPIDVAGGVASYESVLDVNSNIQHKKRFGAKAFNTFINSETGILGTAKIPVSAGDKITVASYAKYQKGMFFNPINTVVAEFGSEGDHQNELRTVVYTAPTDGWVQGVSYILNPAQDFYMEIEGIESPMFGTAENMATALADIADLKNNVKRIKRFGAENFTVDIGSDAGNLATPLYDVLAGDVITVRSYAKYQKGQFFKQSDNGKIEFGLDGDHQNELVTAVFRAPENGKVQGVSYVRNKQDFYIEIERYTSSLYIAAEELPRVTALEGKVQKIFDNVKNHKKFGAGYFTDYLGGGGNVGYLWTAPIAVKAGAKVIVAGYSDIHKGEMYNMSGGLVENFGSEGEFRTTLKAFVYTVPTDGTIRALSYVAGAQDFYVDVEGYESKMYATPEDLESKAADIGSSFEMGAPKSIIKINFETPFALPTSKLDGKIGGVVTFQVENLIFRKYAKIEVQGASSAVYPKKNWTIGFYNDAAFTSKFTLRINNTFPLDEWVYKAYWIDATFCRNIVGNRLWAQFEQSRSGRYKREIDTTYIGKTGAAAHDTGATGIVDGFPCELMINGAYYGIGTFNSGKKVGNYNLSKSNDNHIQIEQGENPSMPQLDFVTMVNGDYAYRSPTNTATAESRIADFKAFAALAQTPFTAAIGDILDVRNVDDYYILVQALFLIDNEANNTMLTSWGGKFFFMPYDLDSSFGLKYDGSSIYAANLDAFTAYTAVPANTRAFWAKVKVARSAPLAARYAELKAKGILTADNILKLYNQISFVFGQERYNTEFTKWPGLPSKGITDASQIYDWFTNRLTWLDAHFS